MFILSSILLYDIFSLTLYYIKRCSILFVVSFILNIHVFKWYI